jgi:hypothetical protein
MSRIGIRSECTVEFPDKLQRKGTDGSQRFRPPLLDSFLLEVLGIEAELQSLTVRLRVTSNDGRKSWSKLGFWF